MSRVVYSSRPLPLELTAVGETVVMENLEIFRMNGFQFQIDMEGKPEEDSDSRLDCETQHVCTVWLIRTKLNPLTTDDAVRF